MKEWILRYAEQQDEEEKSGSSKSLDEEEKFDPVSRTRNPALASWELPGTVLNLLYPVFLTWELDRQLSEVMGKLNRITYG